MIFDPITASIIRPANVTAYAPNQAYGTATSATIEIDLDVILPRAVIAAYLVEVLVRTNIATFLPRLRAHLYGVRPTDVVDRASFAVLWADRAKRLGAVDIDALLTGGAGSDQAFSAWREIPKRLHMPTRKLWLRTEVLDAATPVSGQVLEYQLTLAV